MTLRGSMRGALRGAMRRAMAGNPNPGGFGPIYNVAFVGDSITDQGSASLLDLRARGYYGWAQAFNRQRWTIAPNTAGSRLAFATSSASTATIVTNHMAAALASGADTIVWHSGQNDRGPGSLTAAQAATNMRDVWATIKAAGIRPVATTLTGVKGALSGAPQTWILDFNALIRTHAAADGVLLCDWATVNNVGGADNAVLDAAYAITADDIHPNSTGSSRMGRVLAATLAPFTDDTVDPFLGLTNVSVNPSWTGGPKPDNWTHTAGGSNTIVSQTYEAAADPSKWWRINHTQGGINSTQIITFSDTISVYNAVRFATLLEIEVLSGALTFAHVIQQMGGGGSVARGLFQVDGATLGAQITPADGRVILRTPATVGNGSTNLAYPDFNYGGSADFRIRRLASYSLP